MSELKEFDDLVDPDEDSYETQPKLVKHLEKLYNLKFELDAAATDKNTICDYYLFNALYQEWILHPLSNKRVDVWCNPPHSLNEEFVRRAHAMWIKYNINICVLIPQNTCSAGYYHELIESETRCFVENHPLLKRPTFLKNGRKTKHGSRNAYQVIIFRKKS